MDQIAADMDTTELTALFLELRDSSQTYVNEASQETAEAIAREAKARLHRQLGPNATGLTEAGIAARPAYDNNGFIVISEREPFPNLPLWLEKGTKKGRRKDGSLAHSNYARPYFWISAELEAGAHYRRIGEALGRAISEKGLGL